MKRSIRLQLLLVLVVLTTLLTACDTILEIGIEPTSTPIPTPTLTPVPSPSVNTFTNGDYGFAFEYLSTWTLTEEPHVIRVNQGSLILRIGYRWATESVDITGGRTGMPGGTLIYSDKILFLGQVIPAHTLEYERKDKMVLYGEQSGAMIKAGDLVFCIWLEDLDAKYDELDIPKELQTEAKTILESFRRIEAIGQPPAPSPTPPPVPTRTLTPSPDAIAIVGWYGSVQSLPAGSDFDDYLSVLPEGAAEVGLVGTSPALESMIAEMRDKMPPNKYAHFWGTLNCGVSDYNGCQLQVTHMRPDGPGPIPNPDPVEGWEGTIVTDSAWAQFDDAFVLAGDYPVQYGIWSEDPSLAAQLESYRNSGVTIRVWGQVVCGLPDANGCQIQVRRLEEALGVASPAPESEWASYDNDAYAFSFQYPASWTLKEIPGRALEDAARPPSGAMPVRCADAILVSQDTLAISIQYYRKSDDGPIAWCDDATIIEPTNRDEVAVMGREAVRTSLVYQDEIKAVDIYVDDGADLLLQIALRDVNTQGFAAPEMKTIPAAALIEFEQILNSFEPR